MVKTSLNFNTKCRSCLTENHEMHYLFSEFDQGLNLANILQSTTNLETEESDGLSPYLCESCTTIVVEFFNFKAIYLENINYIKSLKNTYSSEGCDGIENTGDSETGREIESGSNIKNEKLENNLLKECMSTDCEKQFRELQEVSITGEYVEDIIKHENSVNTGENVDSFLCEECAESFSSKALLQKHMECQHELSVSESQTVNLQITDENIILQCEMCNEKFKTYAEIDEHWKTHKKYVCEHCGAGFLKKSYLNDHVEVHSSMKRHVCPICGKAFKRRTVLVKHKRIHTHPRQNVCEICGLRFTDKGTLKTHIMLKHTKERNFNCTICEQWFPLKSTLMKHINRHNEDRQREFVCSLCHLAYKDKSSLNRHVVIKHTQGAKKPNCKFCGKQYTTKTNLLKHIRKNHKPQSSFIEFD